MYRVVLLCQKNQTYIHGLTLSLKNVQSHAVVVISLAMLLVSNRERRKLLTTVCVTLRRNQLNGRNAVYSTAHRNGLRASGVNVQRHVDKTELENVKFIVRESALMGKSKFTFLITHFNYSCHLHSAVTIIDDDVCLELAGNKPATVSACNEGKICPTFFLGKWSPCNKLCGEGKQTRQVICHRREENGKITILDDVDCTDEKPAQEQECMVVPCEGVDYISSSWSGVS